MGFIDIFRKKTGGTEECEAPDDVPCGLDVWVEGVEAIVEYVSLAVFCYMTAANYRPLL